MAAIGSILLKLLFITHIFARDQPNEFYSSMVNMEMLLKSELNILDRLDSAIGQLEKQNAFLRAERGRFRGDTAGALHDPAAFVSNPVRAFLMMKRLVKDYRDIDDRLRKGTGVDLVDSSTVLPTEDDLEGVAEGLSRLQDLYKMEASELAKGNVYGHKLVRELKSEECYRIGVAMTQGKYFANANQWFREALKRWKADDAPEVSKVEILDYFSYSLSENEEHEEAIEITFKKKKVNQKEQPPHFVPHRLYEPLCRGDYHRPASETSQLYCQYQTTTPFLRYAPLKQELLNLDPPIALYHDVASNREISRIINLAKPRITRSTVIEAKTKQVTPDRTSQHAWFLDEQHPVIATFTRRTQDITGGLKAESYELLQVNNYGIGGHYLQHYDFTKNENVSFDDRIATVMFYLSDVAEGGATVFPRLRLAVSPRKGTAILWYNLLRNGNGDRRTLHAACPVLRGSKWVANLWIHEYHQEFVRPCDLDPEK